MNAKVIGIKKDKKNKLTGVVYEKDGKKVTLSGDYVISSMPIKDLVIAMNDVPKKMMKWTKKTMKMRTMTVAVAERLCSSDFTDK